jgi:hypothetical protein
MQKLKIKLARKLLTTQVLMKAIKKRSRASSEVDADEVVTAKAPTKQGDDCKLRSSAVTITFGDCAENHVGKHNYRSAASGLTCAQACRSWAKHLRQAAASPSMIFVKLSAPFLRWAPRCRERLSQLPHHITLVPQCEMIDLVAAAELDPSSTSPAALLIIRNGAHFASRSASTEALLQEQLALRWDARALMKGRVVNKHARHNICYGDTAQEPNYEAGFGHVSDFVCVSPCFSHLGFRRWQQVKAE